LLGISPVEANWSGLRPFAEGGRCLIGPTRIKGLFLATGYYRSGILIGPIVGKLLAEGIASGKFSPLLKPFFPT
jgi:D-amino-acid dehydrogenase